MPACHDKPKSLKFAAAVADHAGVAAAAAKSLPGSSLARKPAMEGSSAKSSVWSSGTVVAAIISGVTAMLTALLPWVLDDKEEPRAKEPSVASSPVTPGATGFVAQRPASDAKPLPSLTFGAWTITSSTDEEGTDFTGSTLKFISQHETRDGLEATGFFEWRGNGELLGREHVVAHFDAGTRQLFIEGKYVESPKDVLAIGSFSAKLSEDGRQLIDGSWGNTPGNRVGMLGTWEARR
jgi:hypothetical protein